MLDLKALLDDTEQHVKTELKSNPTVVDVGDDLDLEDLAVGARRWARVNDVVAVVADLKNSTKLGMNKRRASTAAIYEAAVAPLARILLEFDAGDIDIQGDCAVGVFWGVRRLERAFCAGVTIKTFSERQLQPQLEDKWDDLPETGFKIGLAASPILVKRIGVPRKPETQEEVWAGKAVNYAAKAAQCSDRNEMWVTGTAWDRLEKNDYITYSCSCGSGPSPAIWDDVDITRLPDGEDRYGRKLKSQWCVIHSDEFCNAILSGKTSRQDVTNAKAEYGQQQVKSVLAQKRRSARQLRVVRLGRS